MLLGTPQCYKYSCEIFRPTQFIVWLVKQAWISVHYEQNNDDEDDDEDDDDDDTNF